MASNSEFRDFPSLPAPAIGADPVALGDSTPQSEASTAPASLPHHAMTLPDNLPSISDAKLPVAYEQARTALEACVKIDECKEWADRMEALASYARQSDDETLLNFAIRIKGRAVRRVGEILNEIEPAPGGGNASTRAAAGPSGRKAAADEVGISDRQRKTALRVANVPEAEFEKAIESTPPATVTELAERGTVHEEHKFKTLGDRDPRDFQAGIKLRGMLRDFCREAAEVDVAQARRGLDEAEVVDVHNWMARIEKWIAGAKEILSGTDGRTKDLAAKIAEAKAVLAALEQELANDHDGAAALASPTQGSA